MSARWWIADERGVRERRPALPPLSTGEEQRAPLVSQGARSSPPDPSPPTPDDWIRSVVRRTTVEIERAVRESAGR